GLTCRRAAAASSCRLARVAERAPLRRRQRSRECSRALRAPGTKSAVVCSWVEPCRLEPAAQGFRCRVPHIRLQDSVLSDGASARRQSADPVMHGRLGILTRRLSIVATASLVAGCNWSQSILAPRGSHAETIDILSWAFFIGGGAILALVAGCLAA